MLGILAGKAASEYKGGGSQGVKMHSVSSLSYTEEEEGPLPPFSGPIIVVVVGGGGVSSGAPSWRR